MQKTTASQKKITESVYAFFVKDANLSNLKCLSVLAALAAISMILNYIDIFSVQRSVMIPSMVAAFAFFVIPIAVYILHDKLKKNEPSVLETKRFRNLIIACVFLGVLIVCVFLSFHATIVLIFPSLMAAQYRYDKKLFRIVFILTLLLVPISIYGSFFLGVPDRNFIKGGLTDEDAKILANRLTIATPQRMLELFTHYTLPLLFGVLVVVVAVKWIIVRNGMMLEKQIKLSKKVREEIETRNEMQNQVIEVLANLIETRDVNTGEHVIRTKKLVGVIARALQKDEKYRNLLTDDVIDRMENAAPLHDVGKIIVSDTILLKPGKLTEEEFEKMKIHTSAGEELIAKLFRNMNDTEFLQTAKDIAVYHHERWDGKGYPKGLSQDAIPLCARIMAIADVYDALISVRVYKPAIDPEKALEIIMSESGTHFDPDIIRVINDIKDELADIANISGTDENSHNKT